MRRVLLLASLIASITTFQPSPVAAAAVSTCPDAHFAGQFSLPPAGIGYEVTLTVNDDCTVSSTPVSVVDAQEALRRYRSQIGTNESSQFARIGEDGPAGIDPDYHMDGRVWDCCGIIMTQLVTDLAWSSSGATITAWSAGGYESHHGEVSCWPNNGGWSTVTAGTYYDSGGNGQNFVKVHGHGEWSYRGVFDDCIGTIFYNTFDNYVTGFSIGDGDCGFSWNLRHTAPGWHLVATCYNPARTIVDISY